VKCEQYFLCRLWNWWNTPTGNVFSKRSHWVSSIYLKCDTELCHVIFSKRYSRHNIPRPLSSVHDFDALLICRRQHLLSTTSLRSMPSQQSFAQYLRTKCAAKPVLLIVSQKIWLSFYGLVWASREWKLFSKRHIPYQSSMHASFIYVYGGCAWWMFSEILGQRIATVPNCSAKVKLSLCFNWASRHGGVLEEWRYSATHSWPRH